jgi:Short C-terminal domain
MPGLLRGVARTAVVAGTATAVSNRVSRRQGNRWSRQADEQEPQEAPQPEPAASAPQQQDTLAMLTQLGQLHKDGVLTDAEFEAQKAKLLG